jgi:hypothetical protein
VSASSETEQSRSNGDKHYDKLIAAATVVLAALALIAAIAVPLAPPGSMREAAIACGVLALGGLLLNAIFGGSRRSIAIGSALLIGIAAALAGVAFTKSVASKTQVVAPSGPVHISGLGISLAYHQSIPWCTSTLNGTGKIPNGYSLVVLDREVSANNQASNSYYSFDGKAVPSGTSWSLSTIYIGPRKRARDFYDELTVFLVRNADADFLASIRNPWLAPGLPQALQSTNAFVLRNEDLSQCS